RYVPASHRGEPSRYPGSLSTREPAPRPGQPTGWLSGVTDAAAPADRRACPAAASPAGAGWRVFGSSEPLPDRIGGEFDQYHHDEDLQDDDRHVVIRVEAATFVQEPADPARADDAQNGGDPHVEFERVEPLIGEQ